MQIIINGIITGFIYALVSIGFNLIYSGTRFYHLAYSGIALLGAYLTYYLINKIGLGFIHSIFFSAFFIGFLGVLFWQFLYKPLKQKKISNTSMIVASLGLLIIIQNLFSLVFGNTTKVIYLSDTIKEAYSIFGIMVTQNQFAILIIALTIIVIFDLFLNKTRTGLLIKATGENSELAQIIGIDSNKIIIYSFYIGTFLSSLGASLISLEIGIKPQYALWLILKVIIVCIIGGIGNIRGALVGSLILGVSESVGAYFLGGNWQDVIAFSVLTIFLLIKNNK